MSSSNNLELKPEDLFYYENYEIDSHTETYFDCDFNITANSKMFTAITRTSIPMNFKFVKDQNWPMNITLEKLFPDKVERIFSIPLVMLNSECC